MWTNVYITISFTENTHILRTNFVTIASIYHENENSNRLHQLSYNVRTVSMNEQPI